MSLNLSARLCLVRRLSSGRVSDAIVSDVDQLRLTAVRLLRWAAVSIAMALSFTATSSTALAADPLRLMSVMRLDPRLEQLAFRTPALAGVTDVRILLPAGYDSHPRRRYPVLYLLHGAIDNYSSWTVKGDAEQLTARYPLIVVMPDSGPTGGYTNWYNGGADGPSGRPFTSMS
jgi:S-formylglutathione hydrolase FrmB